MDECKALGGGEREQAGPAGGQGGGARRSARGALGRGLHASSSQLNLNHLWILKAQLWPHLSSTGAVLSLKAQNLAHKEGSHLADSIRV